jgi:hypothetical protein
MKISTIIKLIIISPVYLYILLLQIHIVIIELIMVLVGTFSYDKFLKNYTRRQILATDQVINALMAGDEDETISARAGRVFPDTWWAKLINTIFHWQKSHCINAIEEDEGGKDILYPRV